MRKIIILLNVLIYCACSVNTSKEIDLEKITFNYRDDAYIFFRNMRQTNYDIEILEKAGWRIYRHEDNSEDTGDYYFKTALVVNWRANKAYPIIEMQKSIEKDGLQLSWVDPKSNESGTIALGSLSRFEEMKLLTQIYNHVMKERKLNWKPDGEISKPLFANSDEIESFRVTMYDFFRLTGQL